MKRFLGLLLIFVISLTQFGGCDSSTEGGKDLEIIYVAIGASDAVGIGAIPFTNGYVFRIRDALEEESFNVELRNLGILAAELDEINEAVDMLLSEIGSGLVGNPDLITIWVGANDIISGVNPEEFESNLESVLVRLFAETTAFIVIANVPDLTQLPRFIENPSDNVTIERISAFNAIIESLAVEFDIPLVDLFAEPIDDMLVSQDGFHPSNEGHQRIANLFLQKILPEF
ncbi:MAG TPA: SGNH/GDSL hydrolase family protein [Thermodesulfobacteriota bacterium]|nr:SGNH/GDSL hydrolase family protein [Thermodesulfobacteriota bacterium]